MKLTGEVEEVKTMNVMTIYWCDWWDLQNVRQQQVAEYYSVKQNWNNFFFIPITNINK